MSDVAGKGATEIGRLERRWLYLVYGGPVTWWIPMARIVGVRVDAPDSVDDVALAHAEAGAVEAARRFGPALLATTVSMVAMAILLPMQGRAMEPIRHVQFHAVAENILRGGSPYWLAIVAAVLVMLATGLALGLLNAALFGGIPLFFLRRCTAVASPAVAIALAQGDEAIDGVRAAVYPRVAYAAERILYPKGR